MNIGLCCRHLLKRYSDRHQAVICKNWILPLRLAVLSSLFGHLFWRACHPVVFYTAAIIIIHSIVALLLLAECRKSEKYYSTINDFERREAVMKDDLP
ncbi:hypothetical protein [Desulfopila aestuarii]|uniref:Uncharacterized protein n=1 Tax=Desulfopila aestuarii DSM 18488 TaxID=1121416 RepID=A0A1M7YK03_9BACT|nr:hypothetical protein [Desulfopila aestuarii]SHO52937.1 hypothetical protein SAMN02745220_04844 [Desulfopila aestuarii DSM 18488]